MKWYSSKNIEMQEQEAQAQKAERLRPKLEAQLRLHEERGDMHIGRQNLDYKQ